MTDVQTILRRHGETYPQMQPQDAVKLLYQMEFGGGHMIADANSAALYLAKEWKTTQANTKPLAEPIGGGLCRVNLAALQEAQLPTLNRLFVATANAHKGGIDAFKAKLALLLELAKKGEMPFSAQALEEYLAGYAQDGYPMVSHSALYRAAYAPAYRVVSQRYMDHFDLYLAIDEARERKQTLVLAIDGRCGSGKSTLAQELAQVYACQVIAMDDFFLPIPLRTKARMEEPGGNVHYERFDQQVIAGLRQGEGFSYGVFECGNVMQITHENRIEPGGLLVVEGSYSLHPKFGQYADISVFMDIDPRLQTRRILARNGEEMLQRFVDTWIPMEEDYFQRTGTKEKCDFVYKADELP